MAIISIPYYQVQSHNYGNNVIYPYAALTTVMSTSHDASHHPWLVEVTMRYRY